jgi:hypothetical protein
MPYQSGILQVCAVTSQDRKRYDVTTRLGGWQRQKAAPSNLKIASTVLSLRICRLKLGEQVVRSIELRTLE